MAELYIKQRGGPEVNILAPAGHTMSAGETVNSVHVSYPRVKTWVSVISFGTGILCLLLLFVCLFFLVCSTRTRPHKDYRLGIILFTQIFYYLFFIKVSFHVLKWLT